MEYRPGHTNLLAVVRSAPVVFLLFLLSCQSHHHLRSYESEAITVDSTLERGNGNEIENILRPYREQLEEEMDDILGHSAIDLVNERPEGTMGLFAANCLAEKAVALTGLPIAFALQNYSGLRIPIIPAGPITVGQVYEMMPFENYLVVIDLPTEALEQLINEMARRGGEPVSGGLEYTINDGKASNILIHGKPLARDSTYHVALPDYLARGGLDMGFLRDHPHINTNRLVRELYMDCLRDAEAEGVIIRPVIPQNISPNE